MDFSIHYYVKMMFGQFLFSVPHNYPYISEWCGKFWQYWWTLFQWSYTWLHVQHKFWLYKQSHVYMRHNWCSYVVLRWQFWNNMSKRLVTSHIIHMQFNGLKPKFIKLCFLNSLLFSVCLVVSLLIYEKQNQISARW